MQAAPHLYASPSTWSERPASPRAKERLRNAIDTVLVIDDFHYMPQDAQLDIIRGLKPLVFDGLRVVIVGRRARDAAMQELRRFLIDKVEAGRRF